MSDDVVAPVLSASFHASYPRTWLLTVLCPYCGRHHFHGSGSEELGDLGHRLSHCSTRSGSYRLVLTAETDFGE